MLLALLDTWFLSHTLLQHWQWLQLGIQLSGYAVKPLYKGNL